MASLRRIPRSKYWIACYTDKDGRQRQRSTKVEASGPENKRRAQKVADTFEEAARKAKTKKQIRRVTEDLIREIEGEDAPRYTVEAWLRKWVESLRAICSAGSVARYEGQVNRFLEWMGDRDTLPLVELERSDIQAYRDARLKVVTVKTVKHEIDCLRRCFKTAVEDSIIAESPTDGVKLPRLNANTQTLRRGFTPEEVRAVLRVADPEWRSMVIFGLYTAQRLGDIAKLSWADIDTAAGIVRLTTQKTGATLEIPIADPLQGHIASLPLPDRPDARVHPHAFEIFSRHGKTANLSGEFRRIMVRAGLVEHQPHRKAAGAEGRGGRRSMSAISFHSLRHLATSGMKNAGVNNDVVMATVGHESAAVSRGYTHAEMEAMRAAVNSLPDYVSDPEGKSNA